MWRDADPESSFTISVENLQRLIGKRLFEGAYMCIPAVTKNNTDVQIEGETVTEFEELATLNLTGSGRQSMLEFLQAIPGISAQLLYPALRLLSDRRQIIMFQETINDAEVFTFCHLSRDLDQIDPSIAPPNQMDVEVEQTIAAGIAKADIKDSISDAHRQSEAFRGKWLPILHSGEKQLLSDLQKLQGTLSNDPEIQSLLGQAQTLQHVLSSQVLPRISQDTITEGTELEQIIVEWAKRVEQLLRHPVMHHGRGQCGENALAQQELIQQSQRLSTITQQLAAMELQLQALVQRETAVTNNTAARAWKTDLQKFKSGLVDLQGKLQTLSLMAAACASTDQLVSQQTMLTNLEREVASGLSELQRLRESGDRLQKRD